MTTPENNKVPFVSATANGDDVNMTIRGKGADCAALSFALIAAILKDNFAGLPNEVLADIGKEGLEAALSLMDKTENISIDMDAIEHGMQPD